MNREVYTHVVMGRTYAFFGESEPLFVGRHKKLEHNCSALEVEGTAPKDKHGREKKKKRNVKEAAYHDLAPSYHELRYSRGLGPPR